MVLEKDCNTIQTVDKLISTNHSERKVDTTELFLAHKNLSIESTGDITRTPNGLFGVWYCKDQSDLPPVDPGV